jgi:lipid-A-disaccharide synthase
LGAAAILLAEQPGLQLALPQADSIERDFLRQFINAAPANVREAVRIIPGRSREILAIARAAVMASGTSSVEALFLGTPMAVTYKVSPFSWFVGKNLVSVPYVSIANLVAGREVLPELLQDKAMPENLAAALRPLLNGGPEREAMLAGLAEVRAKLGPPGASGRVLDIICEEIAKGGRRTV